MGLPDGIVWAFVFALGCCIGSFLNVVIYRLPRGKSLVHPGSACPHCGRLIRFYDNIPLVSWLALGAKCRSCKMPISGRYFLIELLTGLVFLGLFVGYFRMGVRHGMTPLLDGGWVIYLTHITLLAAFIAASAIDLESWIIPLTICWFVTGAGLAASTMGAQVLPAGLIAKYSLLPVASDATGALAAGAIVGLGISLTLLAKGLIKRSYESQQDHAEPDAGQDDPPGTDSVNHRIEILKEVLFLIPIVVCSVAAWWVAGQGPVAPSWARLMGHPAVSGLLGSVWGYFIGCGIVWVTRILGTLAFGKEAMGLGDVHLMGAAGAVVGPVMVTMAFFIAPFFGLAWALTQMISKKIHQIPYGPFLSLATLTVMICHDCILDRLAIVLGGP